jgi:hypothetical protein
LLSAKQTLSSSPSRARERGESQPSEGERREPAERGREERASRARERGESQPSEGERERERAEQERERAEDRRWLYTRE